MCVEPAQVQVAVEDTVRRSGLSALPQIHEQEGEVVEHVAGRDRI